MGSGKTTVGKQLARDLNREFVDLDQRIEAVSGKTIAESCSRKSMGISHVELATESIYCWHPLKILLERDKEYIPQVPHRYTPLKQHP